MSRRDKSQAFWAMLIPALGKSSSQSTEQVVVRGKVSCKGQRAALGPGVFAGGGFLLWGHTDAEGSSLKALLGRGLACQSHPLNLSHLQYSGAEPLRTLGVASDRNPE